MHCTLPTITVEDDSTTTCSPEQSEAVLIFVTMSSTTFPSLYSLAAQKLHVLDDGARLSEHQELRTPPLRACLRHPNLLMPRHFQACTFNIPPALTGSTSVAYVQARRMYPSILSTFSPSSGLSCSSRCPPATARFDSSQAGTQLPVDTAVSRYAVPS